MTKARIGCALLAVALAACGGAPQPAYSPEQVLALRQQAEAHAGRDAVQLARDVAAMGLAQNLFGAHCASCHGADARGKLRVPDLAQGVLDYGDSAAAIRSTITAGRHSVMPKVGHLLGEFELGVLSAYIKSLSGGEPLDTLYTGKALELYAEHCVTCHGAEAKGDLARGVPDLTDASWQFAGAVNGIRMTLTGGTESNCPPQEGVLAAAEIELLTGYLLQLRSGN